MPIIDNIQAAVDAYVQHSAQKDFSREKVQSEVNAWMNDLVSIGHVHHKVIGAWFSKTLFVVEMVEPVDTSQVYTLRFEFNHLKGDGDDLLDAYDRAMAGI